MLTFRAFVARRVHEHLPLIEQRMPRDWRLRRPPVILLCDLAPTRARTRSSRPPRRRVARRRRIARTAGARPIRRRALCVGSGCPGARSVEVTGKIGERRGRRGRRGGSVHVGAGAPARESGRREGDGGSGRVARERVHWWRSPLRVGLWMGMGMGMGRIWVQCAGEVWLLLRRRK